MSHGPEGEAPEEAPLWAPARENLTDFAGAALTVGVISAGLSWLGPWYWRFELLANLRPPMALVLGLGVLLFLTAVLGVGVPRVKPAFGFRVLLGEDHPAIQALDSGATRSCVAAMPNAPNRSIRARP